MKDINAKIYEKYTALKKRKLHDALELNRKTGLEELCKALKDWAGELKKENGELYDQLVDKQDELDKARMDFLEDIRAKDSELLRLKQLLAEKTDKNKSTVTEAVNRTPEVVLENQTPISPTKKTPQSNSKKKRVRLSEEAVVPCNNSGVESRKLECSRRHTCISGNERNERPNSHMFNLLLQCLVGMKILINDGTERFSISVSHEASGYSFTLTWLEKHGEWSYKLSSLGTLERIAVDWMKQDIRFSMNMCRRFFERISSIIKKS